MGTFVGEFAAGTAVAAYTFTAFAPFLHIAWTKHYVKETAHLAHEKAEPLRFTQLHSNSTQGCASLNL